MAPADRGALMAAAAELARRDRVARAVHRARHGRRLRPRRPRHRARSRALIAEGPPDAIRADARVQAVYLGAPTDSASAPVSRSVSALHERTDEQQHRARDHPVRPPCAHPAVDELGREADVDRRRNARDDERHEARSAGRRTRAGEAAGNHQRRCPPGARSRRARSSIRSSGDSRPMCSRRHGPPASHVRRRAHAFGPRRNDQALEAAPAPAHAEQAHADRASPRCARVATGLQHDAEQVRSRRRKSRFHSA